MVDDVVNLDEHRPHLSGLARCAECKHEWEAVAPIGTTVLECPKCSCFKGFWNSLVQRDEYPLECGSCGNEVFFVYNDCVACTRCGEIPTLTNG